MSGSTSGASFQRGIGSKRGASPRGESADAGRVDRMMKPNMLLTNPFARDTHHWQARDGWCLLALLGASIYAFWDGWNEILLQGLRRTDNSYIFLVPPVAMYLAWLRRPRFQFIRRRPSLTGVAAVALAVALQWFGHETDTLIAVEFAAVLGFVACFVTLAGTIVLREYLAVALALCFLVPIPGELRQALAAPLQSLAVGMTQEILDLASIPSERQGNVLVIAGKPILVAEACDGLRMVLALALTVFAYVFSVPLRNRARLVLLLASPVIALICNIIRLVPTGLAYAYASASAAESCHEIAGWLMLPIAIYMLIGMVRFMRWLDLPVYTWRFLQA